MATYDRRRFLQLGAGSVAAVAGAVVAGAGGPAGATSGARLLAAGIKRGGKVRIGITAESNGINPLSSQLAGPGMYYARAIFDPVCIVTANGSVKPYLCQSVTPNANYTAWTFKLRPGISFHDGTPLDSSAFANYFNNIQHSPFSTTSAFSYLEQVQVVDALTVTVNLKAPWVAMPAVLTGIVGDGQLGLVPAPSMLASPNGGANKPVGTGPFIFESWEPGSQLIVRRNPNYWQKGLPYLDQITFVPIVDDTSRYESLQAGTLDFIQMAQPLIINELLGNSQFDVLDDRQAPPIEPQQSFFMINTQNPPLDDLRVRRALAYATNQKKVIAVTGGGLGTPSTGLFSPGTKYYAPTGYPQFNLRKAKALIAQYKADKGVPTFSIGVGGTTQVDEAEQLQQMWKAAGINVTGIDTVDDNTFISQVIAGKYSIGAWSQYEAPDPDLNYSFWTTSTIGPAGQAAINFSRFGNATIDAALLTGRSNPDQAARIKAYQTISDQFAQYVPYVWITRQIQAVASAKNVTGYAKIAIPDGGSALAFTGGNIWMQQMHLT